MATTPPAARRRPATGASTPDGDGLPDDLDGDGLPDVLTGDGTGETGDGGAASGPALSVRVSGVPKRPSRGRSYEARIRIRNDGEADATRLKARLTRRAGVALSRRVASVSRVRSGKGITVHVRVRPTSRHTTRTARISVSGRDATAGTTLRLRRRAGT